MYLINPPHSASCFSPNARLKHKLLLLAAGFSIYATVLFKECSIKAFAQEGSAPPASRIAQRPTVAQAQVVMLWVNPQTGNDAKADGSEQAPFRTITQALASAQPNSVIQLAPGTYSSDTGEVFPIVLKPGVTVQGNPDDLGQGIVLRGGGSYSSQALGRQNVTLVGANDATLTGVTITNPHSRGHGLWVEVGSPIIRDNTFISSVNAGIVTLGSSVATVENNLFVLNRTGGIVITGHAQPEVRSNIFQRTGAGITVSENAAPQLIGNRLSQNRNGMIVQGNARPVIRENTIEDSDRDGIVVIAQAQPDLGTTQAPGSNVFLNNRQHDINALATSQTLPAFGNQLESQQIAGKVDLTGKAALVSITTVASAASRLPATQVSRASTRSSTVRSTTEPSSQTASARTTTRSSVTSSSVNSSTRSSSVSASSTSSTTSSTPPSTLISSLPPSTPNRASSNPATSSNSADGSSNSATSTRSTASSVTRPVFTSLATEARQSRITDQPVSNSRSSQLTNQQSSQQSVEISVPPPQTATRSTIPQPRSQQAAIAIAVPAAERSAPTRSQANSAQANPAQANSVANAAIRPISFRSGVQRTAAQLSPQPAIQTASASATRPTRAIEIAVPSPEQAASRPNAIEITVPTPEQTASVPSGAPQLGSVVVSGAASLPRQAVAFASPNVPTIGGSPIGIPAPPPETKINPPAPVPEAASSAAANHNVQILPVPSGEIPVGNTGDITRIGVGGATSTAFLTSRRESLQYRVVVEAEDEETQSLVQSLVPGAFVTSLQGQSVVQVGAFSSHDNAQEAIQMLSQAGLRGIIQPME